VLFVAGKSNAEGLVRQGVAASLSNLAYAAIAAKQKTAITEAVLPGNQ